MGKIKKVWEEQAEGLDEAIEMPISWTSKFKKGKIRVTIIYEDKSFVEYHVKNKEDYVITIKSKKYLLLPECILQGKNPWLAYYYNNPLPINFRYHNSKLKTIDFYSKAKYKEIRNKLEDTIGDTVLDAKTLHIAFTSNLINKMYHESRMTIKAWLIIFGVAFVVVLVILQVTGTVDVWGFITGAAK